MLHKLQFLPAFIEANTYQIIKEWKVCCSCTLYSAILFFKHFQSLQCLEIIWKQLYFTLKRSYSKILSESIDKHHSNKQLKLSTHIVTYMIITRACNTHFWACTKLYLYLYNINFHHKISIILAIYYLAII